MPIWAQIRTHIICSELGATAPFKGKYWLIKGKFVFKNSLILVQYGIENACKIDFELVKNQKIQQKINQKPQISPFFNLGIFADMGFSVAYCYWTNMIAISK